ncbi:MAG: hypothetical protein AAGN35_08495 [Bacteroidota bacterium]
MTRTYDPLTEVILNHGYYNAGLSDDFTVAPTEETARFLKRYRLLFGPKLRGINHTWSVLQEQYDGNALLALPSSWQMRFAMTLENGNFLNFTDLPALGRNEIFFFINQNGSTDLHAGALEKMELVSHRFSWEGLSGSPATVTATHAVSGEIYTANVVTEASNQFVRIDLEGLPVGRYFLQRDNLAAERTVYYDPELYGQRIFGIIHLVQENPLNVSSTHGINFSARSDRWKYFVVLKGDHTDYTYAITDKSGANTPLTFADHAAVNPAYTLQDPDTNTESMLNSIFGPNSVSIFVSSQSIPYQESTRSLLALERTKDDTTTSVLANLPNPAAGKAHAAVVVNVDPPNLIPAINNGS